MVALRRTASVAGAAGVGVALLLTLTAFAPLTGSDGGLFNVLVGAGAEAIFTSLTILWIIFGALCLFHLQRATGSLDVLRDAIGSVSRDPRIVAILIAWFFALFAEGAAGFGTAVALAAPFLVGFGFDPVRAVVITLIGHSVGVSFGAVGTPILAQSELVSYGAADLGASAALFHVGIGWVMLVMLLRFVPPEDEGAGGRSIWPWVGLASLGYLLPMFVLATFVGPELPTMGGALIGGAAFAAVVAWSTRRERVGEGAPDRRDVARAASPYLVVIVLILLTRLIPVARDALGGLSWTWSLWGTYRGGFSPLLHPGTVLVAGFLVGAWLTRARRADVAASVRESLRMLAPVTLALTLMLLISRLMVHADMIDALADATASLAGEAWPFLSPWVGVLGTFVTGSATASNILFSEFQFATTERLAMNPLTLLGAQTFGAAVGNIICPHNIIAGCATVGVYGEEGRILRRTLGACALYATLGGLLALVFVTFS